MVNIFSNGPYILETVFSNFFFIFELWFLQWPLIIYRNNFLKTIYQAKQSILGKANIYPWKKLYSSKEYAFLKQLVIWNGSLFETVSFWKQLFFWNNYFLNNYFFDTVSLLKQLTFETFFLTTNFETVFCNN